jgi:hypothetical protein
VRMEITTGKRRESRGCRGGAERRAAGRAVWKTEGITHKGERKGVNNDRKEDRRES